MSPASEDSVRAKIRARAIFARPESSSLALERLLRRIERKQNERSTDFANPTTKFFVCVKLISSYYSCVFLEGGK